ncbi:hypothetical protein [Gryllotalpicola ginsengisoli]|uniref:hypothetical protein n=1 Tax=Gryllotalpicola ginsengisoli TaxID=444608 RepID=UPI0003B63311|nr:hypothetical protein [Gryllotalpicola ginsengisoli]
MRRFRLLVVAAAVAATLSLTGCVPTSGGIAGQVERGLDSADSAAQTALLALTQLRSGKSLSTHAETAVDDALTSLEQEQDSLGSLEPATVRERRWRQRAGDAMSQLDDALQDARSAASGDAGVRWSQAITELRRAEHAVSKARDGITRQAGEKS